MQKQLRLIAIIGAFFIVSGFQNAGWSRFKSTEENFTISLPSEPKQERTNRKSPFGNGHHIYTVESNNISYTISNSSFDAPVPVAKMLSESLISHVTWC